MANLNDTIVAVIKQYARQNGIVKPMLKISRGSKNGDNFSGDVSRVVVYEADAETAYLLNDNNNNEESIDVYPDLQTPRKQLCLIVKTPPENKSRRQMYNSGPHFNRESYFYEQILPAFEQFQEKRLNTPSDQPFDNYPFVIAASTDLMNEYIILKDLVELEQGGYQNAHRPATLDFNKCALVLKTLAKLHAVSFAMKDQEPEKFNKITSELTEIIFSQPINEFLKIFLEKQVDYGLTTLDLHNISDQVVKDKLLQFQKNFGQVMTECVNSKEDAVVVHGDCWISNIMFRQNDILGSNKDLKFLDWQVSRLASPVVDISYFIFCCTDTKLREALPTLLQIYHATLMTQIKALGSDGEKLFSFQQLEAHMKKYAKFGLGMALMTLHTTSCASKDLPNVREILDTVSNEILDSIGLQLIVRPEYIKRMSGVCRDMVNFGYL